MTKEQVKAQIEDIAEMSSYELEKYKQKVGVSGIDDKARYFIYKTIGEREKELNKSDAMVIDGDLDDIGFLC